MGPRVLARTVHERWLRRRIDRLDAARPRHIGLVMDGNRRWARQQGLPDPRLGHRHGAEHIGRVLGWCRELGVTEVTIYVASRDNLAKRDDAEIDHLLTVFERVVRDDFGRADGRWRVHLAGRTDLLPDSTARALELAVDRSRDASVGHLTIAIGYDGRAEIVDAVRRLLAAHAGTGTSLVELAERLDDGQIAAHLDTAARTDPDLIIRTSGERRLSGFLLWQSTHSHLQFCDAYWPGFRRIDLLRAVRAHAARRTAR